MIPHKSRWYASKKEFAGLLMEDFKIRKFIKKHPKKNYSQAGIDRNDDGCRRQGNQNSTVRTPWRFGNGTLREGHGRLAAAVHAAGEDRLRLHRGVDGSGKHRCAGVGQPRYA